MAARAAQRVLEEMAQQGFITPEVAERAKKAGLVPRARPGLQAQARYFFEYVRQVLIDRYGEKQVQNGGFKVYTTIDPALQSVARRAIAQASTTTTTPTGPSS